MEKDIITISKPKSPVSEAYRTLRTNIQFSSFDKKIQTIIVTSCGPSEGKSTTAINLAVTMAESGNKTLVIDCDMRKPKMHKLFNLTNIIGLSNYLIGEVQFENAVHESKVKSLYALTSGTRPPNPSELLASVKMKNFIESLKDKYDYIIIDTPPVIMVSDAQILSQYADGCLLVVASAEADINAAVKAKELLEKVNAKILGVVLNKIDTTRKGYYYGYYYHYYYGNEGKKQKRKVKRKSGFFSRIF